MTGWPYLGHLGRDKRGTSRPCIGLIRGLLLAAYRRMPFFRRKYRTVSPTPQSGPRASKGAPGMANIYGGFAGTANAGPGGTSGGYSSGSGSSGGPNGEELGLQRRIAEERKRRWKSDIAENKSRVAIARSVQRIGNHHHEYLKRAREKVDSGYEG